MKIFLYAFIAAIGNALFVYGQRGTQPADNPFYFLLAALTVCIAIILTCAVLNKAPMESAYLAQNYTYILFSGIGFFVTFVGFYWLYSEHGAINYVVYALLSILTTSIGVGLVIFREPINKYHVISGLLAVAAILVYGFAQHKLVD